MSRLAAARYRQQARDSFRISVMGGCLLTMAGCIAALTFKANWGLFLASLVFGSIGFSMLFSWAIEYRRCNRIAAELERDLAKYSTLD